MRLSRRADVFVDDRGSAIANGDIARAISAGFYTADEIDGELGDLVAAKLVGRRDEQDITVAKLVGLAIQDLATAALPRNIITDCLSRGSGFLPWSGQTDRQHRSPQ